MGKNIRSSSRPKALAPSIPMPPLADAMDAVHLSVDRFCLLAGVEALAEMMEEDATTVCGARHRRHGDRRGYRWGRTHSEIGYHGGKVKVARPRVRDRAGKEVSLESWQALRDGNLLLEWALNLMVLNVSTRKYHRAVRLPEGDLAKARGDGTSKSAVSRRFVALSRKKMKAWLASDLSELDLLVIQIDGLHVGDHVLMAAIGVDGNGDKHVLAVVEGATENTVVVQALIDNLLARGLDPTLPRLFIVDGAKALSKAIRNTFGVAAAIQRCQVHKGRNIIERLPQHLHASVKKALRQAWDQDDANKAERLLRNLVRRLEHEEPGVSGSILEGLEEILTVIRLGLPHELRRSLACTNIVENALGTVRQVTRNVKRWRHAEMALRWTVAGLLEAQKTFRRLKAYRQLPILRNALQEHLRKAQADSAIETIMKAYIAVVLLCLAYVERELAASLNAVGWEPAKNARLGEVQEKAYDDRILSTYDWQTYSELASLAGCVTSETVYLKNVSNQMVKCGPYTNYGHIASANVTTHNQLRGCIVDYQRQGYERVPGP